LAAWAKDETALVKVKIKRMPTLIMRDDTSTTPPSLARAILEFKLKLAQR